MSGPLSEGDLNDGCLACPWHGSAFRIADGTVAHGPATAPHRPSRCVKWVARSRFCSPPAEPRIPIDSRAVVGWCATGLAEPGQTLAGLEAEGAVRGTADLPDADLVEAGIGEGPASAMRDDISHEGLRVLLREEGVTFQRIKTWRLQGPGLCGQESPGRALYAIADREVVLARGRTAGDLLVDEFGPLNLQPRPGRQWAAVSGKNAEAGREPRMRATYTRTEGVRHLLAAYELGEDKLFGHIKPRKTRAQFLEFCRYPSSTRIAIICDNFSPHLSTVKDGPSSARASANNVEIAYTPTNSSWLNRVEAQFTALRYFALDGTHHPSQKEQASMIRRYIIWRNNHAYDDRLRQVVTGQT